MKQPRILIGAGASGSGKTLLTCGLLIALKKRGMKVSSFKCGPDYIDPMFHTKVLGTKSRNLDSFFTNETLTRYLFSRNAQNTDISVIEGAMGYYDGVGGISEQASAYDLARITDTPAILVVNAKGMSVSILPYLKGFLDYKKDSHIKGVILNQITERFYQEIKPLIEETLPIKVYGYLPKVDHLAVESRYLGLVLPDEIGGIQEKLHQLSSLLEESLDLDSLISLAFEASDISEEKPAVLKYEKPEGEAPIRIGIAEDEAFCFQYADNLQLLRELNAQLVPFSPIRDSKLPQKISGLILYGGYPELYAEKLSENNTIRQEIRNAIEGGMPCMAECGGFLYLHKTMEDLEGKSHPMVGIIDGTCYKTDHLGRFGYIELTSFHRTTFGERFEKIRGHEFHYYESTACGDSFAAKKPLRNRKWNCIHGSNTLMAGFPHLYYYSNPSLAVSFMNRCRDYKNQIEIQ